LPDLTLPDLALTVPDLRHEPLNHSGKRQEENEARQKRKDEQRSKSALKRTRADLSSDELKKLIKGCFARQHYWARRDLVAELGNPGAKLLSDGLDELCVKVTKRGNHYGDYQLREHLRSGLPAAAGGPSSAPMP